MSRSIAQVLAELGHDLPTPPPAVGSYVPRLRQGNMLYISGQLPILHGEPQFFGTVPVMADRRLVMDRRAQFDPRSSGRVDVDRRKKGSTENKCMGDSAAAAAVICGLNIIAHIAAEVDDDVDRVEQIVRLGGFVNSLGSFKDHPAVINGASDLMVAVFGEIVGKHVRAAVGASSLPLGVPVEIEALVRVRD